MDFEQFTIKALSALNEVQLRNVYCFILGMTKKR